MRAGTRLAIAICCVLGAAWTCTAVLRPRRVASMTFEQCLELDSPLPPGSTQVTVCYDSNGKATFPVTVVVTFHSSGKTTTLTFTRDSCTEIDIEPGSIGAVLEDQSGQSDDGGFTIEQ